MLEAYAQAFATLFQPISILAMFVGVIIGLLIGIIPMCIILLGVVVFWKLYPLTPEKMLENKVKLKELGF